MYTQYTYTSYTYTQVCISNTNRQLCALSATVGRPKAQVYKGSGEEGGGVYNSLATERL